MTYSKTFPLLLKIIDSNKKNEYPSHKQTSHIQTASLVKLGERDKFKVCESEAQNTTNRDITTVREKQHG